MHTMMLELKDKFPVAARTAVGFTGKAVSSSWDQLMSCQGTMPNPAGVAPWNSRPLAAAVWSDSERREHRDYAKKYLASAGYGLKPEHAAFVKRIVKLLVKMGHLRTVPVKTSSSMGLPWMTNDLRIKHEVLSQWHDRGTVRERARLIGDHNLAALWRDHALLAAYTSGYRFQPDKNEIKEGRSHPKERQMLDWMGKQSPVDAPWTMTPRGCSLGQND